MRKRSGGFTLLEMVIAVAIFAVIASISYAALSQYVDLYQQLGSRGESMRKLQQAVGLLQQDLRYSVERPVRNDYGDSETSFLANPDDPPVQGEVLRLTVAAPDPLHPGRTRLTRVAWQVFDGKLYRATWPVLDRPQDSLPYLRELLDGVDSLELRFISIDNRNVTEFSSEWGIQHGGRPDGAELLLTVGGTVYRRLLEIGNV